MTAAHRAPAKPRRFSNRMIASIVLAVLALMLIVVVVAAAADGSESGYQLNTEGASYLDGWQVGFDTASNQEWVNMGEHKAYTKCYDALIGNTDLVGEELWNAAMGCRDGVLVGQA